MLESLRVKNVALIDEAEIQFTNGLNILTGETGAGKSILIGSINLALGAKADKTIIRTGAEYAFVELVFCVDKEEQLEKLKEILVRIGFKSVTITTGEEHDRIIAYTSQLAHVVSGAYIKSETAKKHVGFSAGSFRRHQ